MTSFQNVRGKALLNLNADILSSLGVRVEHHEEFLRKALWYVCVERSL